MVSAIHHLEDEQRLQMRIQKRARQLATFRQAVTLSSPLPQPPRHLQRPLPHQRMARAAATAAGSAMRSQRKMIARERVAGCRPRAAACPRSAAAATMRASGGRGGHTARLLPRLLPRQRRRASAVICIPKYAGKSQSVRLALPVAVSRASAAAVTTRASLERRGLWRGSTRGRVSPREQLGTLQTMGGLTATTTIDREVVIEPDRS